MRQIQNSILAFFCALSFLSSGQIKAGKIVFERKTNLEKELKDQMDDNLRDKIRQNKFKIDNFELIFNDTSFIFKPILSDEIDKLSWATDRNTIAQNNANNTRTMIMTLWDNEVYLQDTITPIVWKITDSKRTIDKYECRKAIWEKNDTTRIYAWYSTEILSDAGPEGLHGLPGTILGLATEDGGVVYFAKSVETITPKTEDFTIETKRKKVYSYEQLRKKLEEDYGSEDWGKGLFDRVFRWI